MNSFVKKTYLVFYALTLSAMMACTNTSVSTGELPQGVSYSEEEYRIGVGDVIQVSVWKNPDLSLSVPVRPDGKISIPLIGDVQASTMTAEALANNVSEKLSEYVRSPQVTVIVDNASSSEYALRVKITGAVSQQLSIPYRKGMTVMDLVLAAGGVTEFASANKALLYRTDSAGNVTSHSVKIKDILERGKLDTNYEIQPSDIVTVPERIF